MALIRQPQILNVKECSAAEDYRAKADECRKIARQICLWDDRNSVLDMADEWDRLGDRAEQKR
jgi:hypothetical protein